MAKRKADTPDAVESEVVTCGGCGVQVDISKAPTYDARHGEGRWCPCCRSPLTVESVANMQIGLSKSENAAVKASLCERLEA